jgi:hypothetical protein
MRLHPTIILIVLKNLLVSGAIYSQETPLIAICDYCGATYRGGSVKDGPYRYCMGHCRDRGKVLLGYLAQVPQAKIESVIEQSHRGPCDSCGGHRCIDVHKSYRIWSALIYSRWETGTYLACQDCSRQQAFSNLAFCTIAGWWSPPGFLATPFFIVFNLFALFRRLDPTRPSEGFRKLIRMNLARKIASQQ